ncbi:MAG TPA: glycosyltransferase [Tepidisphaeraceae bacterium]|nr:glycosyltransferase [Tepidisphaeraceae bacterium]
MRIGILETDPHGHKLAYVRHLVHVAVEVGTRAVLVTTPSVAASHEFRVNLGAIRHQFDLLPLGVERGRTAWQDAKAKLTLYREACRRLPPLTHLLIPYADGLAQVAGCYRLTHARRAFDHQTRVVGLMMRGGFAYGDDVSLPRQFVGAASMTVAAAAHLDHYFLIDPLAYGAMPRRLPWIDVRRFSLVPDPIDQPRMDRATARHRLGLNDERPLAGLFGILDGRKGLDRLLNAFAAPAWPEDVGLLLMGKVSAVLHGAVERAAAAAAATHRRLVVDNRYVPDEDLAAGLSAVDVVVTPYASHIGSASIALRAAAAGKPVVASDFGWFRYVVPRYGLGLICDTADPSSLARTVQLALSSPLIPSAGKARELHDAAEFRAAWRTQLLRETPQL